MDTGIQIQSIKSQIENMKLQIDNIEMQSNNNMMFNPSMIYEQILNISIQMFNAGMQAFNFGINRVAKMSVTNFYEKLGKISEQITLMIKGNNIQMMPQPILFQQHLPMQQQINNQKKDYMNIQFRKDSKVPFINLIVKFGATVEEVLNQFMQKVYGFENDKTYLYIMQVK